MDICSYDTSMRVRHLFPASPIETVSQQPLNSNCSHFIDSQMALCVYPLRAPTVFRSSSPTFRKPFPDSPRTGPFYRNRSEYSHWPLVRLWTGSYCFRQPLWVDDDWLVIIRTGPFRKPFWMKNRQYMRHSLPPAGFEPLIVLFNGMEFYCFFSCCVIGLKQN